MSNEFNELKAIFRRKTEEKEARWEREEKEELRRKDEEVAPFLEEALILAKTAIRLAATKGRDDVYWEYSIYGTRWIAEHFARRVVSEINKMGKGMDASIYSLIYARCGNDFEKSKRGVTLLFKGWGE